MVDLAELTRTRVASPGLIASAYRTRVRRDFVRSDGRLLIIAADHPARGALRAGDRPQAMADRAELLDRLLIALGRPGVDGVLAAADLMEDLLLLGALDGKVAIGSMNRGGIAGSVFEVDDRFTGYDAESVRRWGLDAGKLLLRIDPDDPSSADMLEHAARAVSGLAERELVAMVEPFMSRRSEAGELGNDLSADAVLRSAVIAAGLGTTSAYTWLKLPVGDEIADMERIAAATSLPIVLLGGEVGGRPDENFARWEKALELPTVRGLTVGRSLLYPPDDDVGAAVDIAAGLLHRRTS